MASCLGGQLDPSLPARGHLPTSGSPPRGRQPALLGGLPEKQTLKLGFEDKSFCGDMVPKSTRGRVRK